MYSFYGGRPGNSFIIITTYRTVAEMVANFKKGPNYTAVHYDEHVMINTVNKNDPDNGKIYRRGYYFANDMGGAEYIGTIVGPGGKAPMLEMTTISGVRTKHASEGYEERLTSGTYTQTSGGLLPGKTDSGTYNDEISWACCSIRNANDEDCTAYIGFTFPYLVVDYETSSVVSYTNGKYADTSAATRVDDESHPFYEKWHINVPKGVKGDAVKLLKVRVANDSIQSYTGQEDDINNSRQVITYDYYNYDTYQSGNPKRTYLGDYNMIKDITLSNAGILTISYTHNDADTWDLSTILASASAASYSARSTAKGLEWIGVGQLIDDGINNKIIKFTISPASSIDTTVDSVIVTAGTLDGSNETTTINSLDLTTATVTTSLTGLQFEVDSGIESSGAAATGFINIAISNMDLLFKSTSA